MFRKLALLSCGMLLLFSCYTHKIVLNSDKNSGTMTIEYNLDDDYFQLLSIAFANFANEQQNEFDPVILIDEELFVESFEESDDIKLKRIKIDTAHGYKGKIVIEFFNLETLLSTLPQELAHLNFKRENNTITISQTISVKEMDPDGIFKDFILQQREDDINFYNRLTQEAKFNFIIQTATPIKRAEGVVLSNDKKRAYYTFTLNDLIMDENKIFKFLISL